MTDGNEDVALDDAPATPPAPAINGQAPHNSEPPPARRPSNRQFRLVGVQQDVLVYRLHWDSDRRGQGFRRSGGYVELSAAQLESARCIRTQALAQAGVRMPPWFGQEKWNGIIDGLFKKITFIAAPKETRKETLVAEQILDILRSCSGSSNRQQEGQRPEPDPKGEPREIDGEYWLKVQPLHKVLKWDYPKLTQGDLSKLLEKIGAIDQAKKVQGRTYRYKVLDPQAVSKLEAISLGKDIVQQAFSKLEAISLGEDRVNA